MKSTKYQLLEADFIALQRDKKLQNELLDKLRKENDELKRLSLWSIRRVHKTYKAYAYSEYEKITGEEVEKL